MIRGILIFILMGLLGNTGFSQEVYRQFTKTPLTASTFFMNRKPVFFDGRCVYSVSNSMFSTNNKVELYRFDLQTGSFEKLALRVPKDALKKTEVIRDIVLLNDYLFLGGLDMIICLKQTRSTDFEFERIIPLKYGLERLYIVDGWLVAEDYYDYHPLDQNKKHVRQIINPVTFKVERTLFLDEASATFTPVMNHFFDIYGKQSLTVKSQEMRIMLGSYDSDVFTDSIVIPRKFPTPCVEIDVKPNTGGDVVSNIKKINELDKYCLERIEKAIFLSEKRILVSVNYPALDSNSIVNRTKRVIVLEKTAAGWETVMEEIVPAVLPDGTAALPAFFRAGFLYTNMMELTAHEDTIVYFYYGKVATPEKMPFDGAAYKQQIETERKADKSFFNNAWLEVLRIYAPH